MGDVRWDGTRWVEVAPAAPATDAGAEWLRSLDWRQFEDLVARAYQAQGFAVTPTQSGADGGIDLVLSRGVERWFVQCKHWKAWKVGASVVREMRGLVAHHGASGGIIVISGRFSEDAYAFARESGIQLVGGPATLALVTTGQLPDASLLGGTAHVGAPTAAPHSGPPRCPVCTSPTVLQRARRGAHRGESFWGCARFPSCRGIVPAQPSEAPRATTAAGARRASPRRRPGRSLVAALLAPVAGIAVMILGLNLLGGFLDTRARVSPGWRPDQTVAPTADPLPPRTIRVGGQPMGIAIDPGRHRGYTANFDSGDVSVIDLDHLEVVETIDVPGRPSAVAIDPQREVLWVTDYNAARVRGIDLATGDEIATLKVDKHPDHLAVDPKKHRLYVTCRESENILVFNTAKNKRLTAIKASKPGSLALDIANQQLYVAGRSASHVYRYDLRTKEWERAAFGSLGAAEIAVDSDRGRLYVADGNLSERNLVVGGSRTLHDSNASALALDTGSETAYIVDTEAETVTAVTLD